MHTLGDISLLERHKMGFLAGSRIAPLSVIPTFEWASETAGREDVAVVSGFHSYLERQVLDLLLPGRCGIVCVLARSLYAKIPSEFLAAYDSGRMLFVSDERQSRATREAGRRRNALVMELADEAVVPKISEDSSIFEILAGYDKPVRHL